MKVRTLDRKTFEADCHRLGDLITADGFSPQLVIGIASGGLYVMDILSRQLNAGSYSVRLQRPGTSTKQHLFGKIIARMPRRLTDLLRICESRLYGVLAKIFPPRVREVTTSHELEDVLSGTERILIVDDAVDSGATMLSIYRSIRAVAPHADVRTAAITLTRPRSVITPDYRIYSDIVRFPWAADAI